MSKFKDETLINLIHGKLKTIEGPVSYYLLKPTQKMKEIMRGRPPIIILFGDIHSKNNKCSIQCKEEDGCFSFYGDNPTITNFFSYISKFATVDLYLEMWFDKTRRTKKQLDMYHKLEGQSSALGEFRSFVKPCLNLEDKKDCQVKDYRIHMTDPRGAFQSNNIDSIMSYAITKYDFQKFKRHVKKYLPDVDYRKLMTLALQSLKLGTKEFMKKVFRYNSIIQKFSKVYKQLSKLPIELQNLIYNNYYYETSSDTSKLCMKPEPNMPPFDFKNFEYPKEDIIVYRDFEQVIDINPEDMYNSIQEITRKYKIRDDLDISICNMTGFTTGLDFYYLGRTFKLTKDDKSNLNVSGNEISIGYFGDGHVEQIQKFLVNNGLYTLEISKFNNDKCLRLI